MMINIKCIINNQEADLYKSLYIHILFKLIGENNNVQTLKFKPIVHENNVNENNEIMLLPHHLRCASHTLNLIATYDFLKAIKILPVHRLYLEAIEKCHYQWNMSRCPKSTEIIKSILGCSLIYHCPTRWNSLFNQIGQLLIYKTKLNTVFRYLNTTYVFKYLDIVYLCEYVILLKPIACALDYL